MKKIFILLLSGFIICTAFIKPPTDYRDSFVGNYFCRSKCQVLSYSYELTNHIDTATIRISKNTRDSILNIVIIGRTYEVKLKNGVLYPDPQRSRNQGKFFSTDSIAFTLGGGLVPSACNYRGKKQ